MWHLRTNKEGRWALFRPYEWSLFNYLLDRKGEKVTSSEAHLYLEQKLSISRASVINKLQDWHKDGLIERIDGTGKGGVHGKYTMNKTPEEAQHYIANLLLKSLNNALTKINVEQLP